MSEPVVAIISPPNGNYFAVGESVKMNVSAASSSMIRTLEIRSGEALLATNVYTDAGSTLSTLITFLPVQIGEMQVSAVAVDARGQRSDLATITIFIGNMSVFPVTVAAAEIEPSPAADTPDCQLAATYMADITIPDGSTLTTGAVYTKTWRVRNTSQCAWLDGYVLAFMDGEQMNAPMTVPVPPTARDASVDINVPVTAPSISGVYSSTWRIRAPNGAAFGNRLYILVRVP